MQYLNVDYWDEINASVLSWVMLYYFLLAHFRSLSFLYKALNFVPGNLNSIAVTRKCNILYFFHIKMLLKFLSYVGTLVFNFGTFILSCKSNQWYAILIFLSQFIWLKYKNRFMNCIKINFCRQKVFVHFLNYFD